ncbi:hypothetical protein D3C71_1755340 [compost metagenome]
MLYFISPLTIFMYFSPRQVQGGYTIFYTEKNLVIIPEITMSCIESAVRKMTEECRFEELRIEID